jgi:EPS-associated MarR family transcriptional regulator
MVGQFARPNRERYVQRVNDPRPSDARPDSVQLELMRLLNSNAELSQREVASKLGVSLGKANYVLRALIEKGFVKAENYRNSTNKLAYFYLLTPSGIAAKAELTKNFLERKMREYEALRLEIEQLRVESTDAASVRGELE